MDGLCAAGLSRRQRYSDGLGGRASRSGSGSARASGRRRGRRGKCWSRCQPDRIPSDYQATHFEKQDKRRCSRFGQANTTSSKIDTRVYPQNKFVPRCNVCNGLARAADGLLNTPRRDPNKHPALRRVPAHRARVLSLGYDLCDGRKRRKRRYRLNNLVLYFAQKASQSKIG